MQKSSRNVEIDPGKSVILRSPGTQNLLARGDVRGVYPEEYYRTQHYQLRRDRPLGRKRGIPCLSIPFPSAMA
jgi:hypothetical protein